MHNTDKQYIRCIIYHNKTYFMHNLRSNFDKFFDLTKSVFKDRINSSGNLKYYSNKPKMTDCEIIALSLTSESLGIDSENYLWGKLMCDHSSDFPNLIDRSNFNRRRKKLYPFLELMNQTVANEMNLDEDVYLVDSIPVPICKLAREKQVKICKEQFETAPDKGYSAVNKAYYFGYKLHLITSVRGIFHSMDLTKASVHDVHFLPQLKYTGLNNCTLIGDKGYLSSECQSDLFSSSRVKLQTPTRSNQKNHLPFEPIYRRFRKRIETLFAQLCDQFMLKRNYAKSVMGLSVRLLTKITGVTILQYFNLQNNKPLNHLKYALAS